MGQAVLVDMVEHEATRRTDKPFAHDVAFWSNMRSMVGGDKEPRYADTLVYADYLTKQKLNPSHKIFDAGEAAIAEWVSAAPANSAYGIIVVSNDKKVRKGLAQAASGSLVTILSTEKFLILSEQLGLFSNDDAAWKRLVQTTTNPPPRKLWGQTP